jgi:hypothetical protein
MNDPTTALHGSFGVTPRRRTMTWPAQYGPTSSGPGGQRGAVQPVPFTCS